MEEFGYGGVLELEREDGGFENEQGGYGVEEGIVPGFSGDDGLDFIRESEGQGEGGERVIRELGPDGAGDMKGVEPGAETVAGEGAEEAFFGAFAVGDDDGPVQAAFNVGPEGEERGGFLELFRADAVDFLSRPEDGLIGLQVRDEEIGDARGEGPCGETDLDGVIRAASGSSSRFEIDGGETGLADGGHLAHLSSRGTGCVPGIRRCVRPCRANGRLRREGRMR